MDKQIVSEMVGDILNDKITEFVESISCDEFIQEVTGKLILGGISIDIHNEEQMDEVHQIIGSKVVGYLTRQILPSQN
jgi:hypothetical protein